MLATFDPESVDWLWGAERWRGESNESMPVKVSFVFEIGPWDSTTSSRLTSVVFWRLCIRFDLLCLGGWILFYLEEAFFAMLPTHFVLSWFFFFSLFPIMLLSRIVPMMHHWSKQFAFGRDISSRFWALATSKNYGQRKKFKRENWLSNDKQSAYVVHYPIENFNYSRPCCPPQRSRCPFCWGLEPLSQAKYKKNLWICFRMVEEMSSLVLDIGIMVV